MTRTNLTTIPSGCRRLYGQYRKSANRRGYPFTLSLDAFYGLTSSPCAYCGTLPSNVYRHTAHDLPYVYTGIDRIDNARGYEAGNVVSCCGFCNRAKSDLPQDTFLAWVHQLGSFQASQAGHA